MESVRLSRQPAEDSDALVIVSFKLLSSHELLPDALSLKKYCRESVYAKKPIKYMYFWKGY